MCCCAAAGLTSSFRAGNRNYLPTAKGDASYLKVEELRTDNGIAEVVFIPKRDTSLPAMIVELKWNESAESAVEQIKKKSYPAILNEYDGELVLVGINYINYNEKTKEHSCRIERIEI